jgi:hypothetical protein
MYRFKLKPHQEEIYKKCWDLITNYFIQHRGAIGSSLHKNEDHLWIAYSRWPDRTTRDASWPSENEADPSLPEDVFNAIETMQRFKKENEDLEQFDEITMQLVMDKL